MDETINAGWLIVRDSQELKAGLTLDSFERNPVLAECFKTGWLLAV
jgi:hypothetical protein